MRWHSTDQNIAWFKDRAEEGSLKIAPPYQRRPVWRLKERVYLIESILMDYPIPEIYVHRVTSPRGKTTYSVVDGQQRIRTVLKFLGLDKEDKEDNGFALSTLDDASQWHGTSFEQLTDEQKEQFYSYQLGVRFVDTKDDAEVRDMFVRLNRYLAALKGQELRNAWFTGAFIQLSTRLADDEPYFAEGGIVTAGTIRRMGDVELVSELLAGCLYGPQDGSRSKIDELYRQFEEYEDEIPNQAQVLTRYQETLQTIKGIFPSVKDSRRWSNRHDFYSLFVAIAHFLREGKVFSGSKAKLRADLEAFAANVDRYIEDEGARVSPAVKNYARAVQKGPSAKARRGVRHQELLAMLGGYFR